MTRVLVRPALSVDCDDRRASDRVLDAVYRRADRVTERRRLPIEVHGLDASGDTEHVHPDPIADGVTIDPAK